MSATSATSGYNVTLAKGGTGTSGTAIAEVVGITGPGYSRNWIDATHLTSDSQAKEFVAGLIDGGEVSVDLNFLPANTTHKLITTDLVDGSKDAYAITWNDASTTTWSFTAGVSGFNPSAPKDDRLSATATFKLSGIITIA